MHWSEDEIRARRAAYDCLVRKRKSCRRCPGLTNPSEVFSGALDTDEIGPWSHWQGNLFPDIVVVGQDFSDQGYFERELGRDNPMSETNIELKRRLNDLGYAVDCGDKGKRHKLFFTNAVLCLKSREHGMQGPLNKEYAPNCSRKFLLPLLSILKPPVIIVLGEIALNAVRDTCGLHRQSLRKAVAMDEGEELPNGSHLFAVYHLNRRTRNIGHRSDQDQNQDWARIHRYLSRGRKIRTKNSPAPSYK